MDTLIHTLGWLAGVYLVYMIFSVLVVGCLGWAILRAYAKN